MRLPFAEGYTLGDFRPDRWWCDVAGYDRRTTWSFPGALMRARSIAASACITYPKALPRVRAELVAQAGRMMAAVRR